MLDKLPIELGKNDGALVTWSGGRDSTLTLMRLLESTNKDVRTISFTNAQIENSQIEGTYRKALRDKLLDIRPFHSIEVELTDNGWGMTRNGGVIQPLIWINLATLYLRPQEDLYMSYVRGDDFWGDKQSIDQIFSISTKIIGKEHSKIVYPLEFYDKCDVFLELHKDSLLHATHYCQTSNVRACNNCHSCQVNNMTIDYLVKEGKLHLKSRVI